MGQPRTQATAVTSVGHLSNNGKKHILSSLMLSLSGVLLLVGAFSAQAADITSGAGNGGDGLSSGGIGGVTAGGGAGAGIRPEVAVAAMVPHARGQCTTWLQQ